MTLNKYGIVKYDAFDDVGGKMSFALAMLDKENTGFILNAIHSRDNCFLYLKEIVKGESYIMLSAEEIDALRQAITMNSIDLMCLYEKSGPQKNSMKERLKKKCIYCYMMVLERAKPA